MVAAIAVVTITTNLAPLPVSGKGFFVPAVSRPRREAVGRGRSK
jgi:hypothetical protein